MVYMQIVYDAVRMACVFAGMMLVIGAIERTMFRPKSPESLVMPWHVVNTKALLLGLIPLFAFIPALIENYTTWLAIPRNPLFATVAIHLLLALQAWKLKAVSAHPKKAIKLVGAFYSFGLLLAAYGNWGSL